MTSSLLADQVVAINQKLADFSSARVSYVAGVVTTVDTVGNTFGANILQPDATATTVSGIRSSAQFMPFVGDTVTLALSGPQIIYLPNGVAGGSIGTIQLAQGVNDTLATVPTKITTWYQPGTPSSTVVGDLWIDTDGGNQLYRYSGSAWVQVQDAGIQNALTSAGTAQATADRKVQTFYRTTAPTNPTDGLGVGDLWFDTANGNKGWRWSGSAWVVIQDTSITSALSTANTALTTAQSKITTYYTSTTPTGASTGDLWVDTGHQNKLYRWSGSAWVVVQDQQIQDALTQAGTAQATADGKVKIFAQTSAPTGETSGDVGDLWFDTDDNNKAYTWSGSAWVARQFGSTALANGAIVDTLLQPTLQLSTTISAGGSSSTRIQLDSTGLKSYVVTGGVSTQTGSYTTSSGTWQMQGQMKSVGTNGRTVILDGQIDTATGGSGKAVGEAGLVWQSTDANQTRYGQFYHASATGAMSMDSPAFSTTLGDGIARYGSTVQTDARGIYGYTEADTTHPGFVARNDGYYSLGRTGVASRNSLAMDATTWTINSGTANRSRVWGDNNNAHLSNPGGSAGCDMNSDGTWAMGHASGQNVYSEAATNKLVLRDRQVATASGINAFVAPGSWFDVWPSYSGATQGGMYVHGDFGATTKNFIIDHPLDEDRKLVHGCTESPQGGLQYWGTVTLDDQGEAEVSLPSYFEALAYPDRRNVQVTLIGQPAPVGADRPKDGKFTVYGPPGREVDWLVHGARRGVDFEVEPLKTDWRPDHEDFPEWQPEKVSKKHAAAGANRRGRQGAWKPNPMSPVKQPPDMNPKHVHTPPHPPHPATDHSSIQGIKLGQTARPTHD